MKKFTALATMFVSAVALFCTGCVATPMLNSPAGEKELVKDAAAHAPYIGMWENKDSRAEVKWNDKEKVLDIAWFVREGDENAKVWKEIPVQAILVKYESGESFLLYCLDVKKVLKKADYAGFSDVLIQPLFFLVKPEFQSQDHKKLKISFVSFLKENPATVGPDKEKKVNSPVDPSIRFLNKKEMYQVINSTPELVKLMTAKRYNLIDSDDWVYTKR